MPQTQAMKGHIEKLQNRFSEFSRITTAQQPEWRKQYLQCRREVNAIMFELSASVRSSSASDQDAIRSLVSRLRHEASLHQAEWPVVSVSLDDPRYQRSQRRLVATVNELAVAAGRLHATSQRTH